MTSANKYVSVAFRSRTTFVAVPESIIFPFFQMKLAPISSRCARMVSNNFHRKSNVRVCLCMRKCVSTTIAINRRFPFRLTAVQFECTEWRLLRVRLKFDFRSRYRCPTMSLPFSLIRPHHDQQRQLFLPSFFFSVVRRPRGHATHFNLSLHYVTKSPMRSRFRVRWHEQCIYNTRSMLWLTARMLTVGTPHHV